MVCALCNRERFLCNSHVLPEFVYAPLYDEKHRFHVLSTGSQPHRFAQKGMREKLFCQDCEQQLSKHEEHVSDVLTGRVSVHSERSGDLIRVTGLRYKPFKLFALSVLWRASVSTLPMFQNVRLGPHAEAIRDLIAREDPGPRDRYGFFLSPLVKNDIDNQQALIIQPTRSRLDNHLCYRFVFGGLIWAFVVSKHGAPRIFRDAFINERGEMLMLVTEVSEASFVQRGFEAVKVGQRGAV